MPFVQNGAVPGDVLLIVDDNSSVSSIIGAYMTQVAGWGEVVTAPDAGRGLVIASQRKPDAIVLDNRMPGGDGIEVLDALRATCPDALIVIHTTDDSIDVRERAERLGADAVVAKGRPLDELAAMLCVD